MSEFQNLLDEAIRECQHEIRLRKSGVVGDAALWQLKDIVLPELLSLRRIRREELPPEKDRWLSSFGGAFFDWGWNQQKPSRLFILLASLDEAYKNL